MEGGLKEVVFFQVVWLKLAAGVDAAARQRGPGSIIHTRAPRASSRRSGAAWNRKCVTGSNSGGGGHFAGASVGNVEFPVGGVALRL